MRTTLRPYHFGLVCSFGMFEAKSPPRGKRCGFRMPFRVGEGDSCRKWNATALPNGRCEQPTDSMALTRSCAGSETRAAL